MSIILNNNNNNNNNKSDKNKLKPSKILWATKAKSLSAIVVQNNKQSNVSKVVENARSKGEENEVDMEVLETPVEPIDKKSENDIEKSNTESITKQGVEEEFKARFR